jgi:Xylose isomerase-like TIM barrel
VYSNVSDRTVRESLRWGMYRRLAEIPGGPAGQGAPGGGPQEENGAMGMLRLAANLSFLWTELPFADRFAAARAAGFDRVEYMFPYGFDADELRSRLDDAGLEQVLFNLPAGDWPGGDRGIAADPSRVGEFRAGVDQALAYAEALGVR